MPEEYFDILDEQGNPTGGKCSRFEAHSQGLWHKTVHIYLFHKVNDKIEFLVHLRSKTKDLNPNTWDTRFGGHLKAGESIEDALVTEIKDEIGLELKSDNFIKGETRKRDKFPNREFTSVYYYNYNDDINKLKFDDGEVQAVKWMVPEDIIESMKKEPSNWSGGPTGFTQIYNFLKSKLWKQKP